MNISIICPLYNAEKYIENLNKSILRQKHVDIASVKYILTDGNDNTEIILKKNNLIYEKIEKNEFSHSLTREKAAFEAKGQIIVLISQDIIIEDNNWLYNLTKDVSNGKCDASFSRQISKDNGIEKYIRERNYPEESRIVDKSCIEKLGLMTFFYSDVSSAILKDVFIKLNGYDGKDFIINEDMYLAYKLIINGYRIKYCSDSCVVHSHNLTLSQLYNRYYKTGIFFKENSFLRQYKVNESGIELTFYILKKSLNEKNYKVFLKVIPNFAARFIAMKLGEISFLKCV